MASGAREVRGALQDTLLAGRSFELLGDCVIVDGLADVEVLEAWVTARQVLPLTGRWPVAVTSDELRDMVARTAEDVRAFTHRVERTDPWSVFSLRRAMTEERPVDEDVLRDDQTFRPFTELPARMVAELGSVTTEVTYERWLYDACVADSALRDAVRVDHLIGIRQWFRPDSYALAFLPTELPWMTPLWLSYFGALGTERAAALGAAEREWAARYGAELVASWGTMLQFTVSDPPRDAEAAWQLAVQLKEVGGNLDMPVYELALALPRSNAWFLHDRP